MKKTVLITGTSSGIGKATVFEFAKMGWNVIASLHAVNQCMTEHVRSKVQIQQALVHGCRASRAAVVTSVMRHKPLTTFFNCKGMELFGSLK